MVTDGTNLGGGFTDYNVAAVATDPDGVTVLAEDLFVTNIREELAVAFLV